MVKPMWHENANANRKVFFAPHLLRDVNILGKLYGICIHIHIDRYWFICRIHIRTYGSTTLDLEYIYMLRNSYSHATYRV